MKKDTYVTYKNVEQYIGNRPKLDIELVGPKSQRPVYQALVDTGADYLMLPDTYAQQVGLSLSSAQPYGYWTANSWATSKILRNLDVIVEGLRITIDVVFDPLCPSGPILGRSALLAAIEVGFNDKEWYWL